MHENDRVAIIGLVARFLRPKPASPRTREAIPKGYGVREQCLPYVAAAALGYSVPSPFSWGYCLPSNVPEGAKKFRSPIVGGCKDRVFYVIDDPGNCFHGNEFIVPPDTRKRIGNSPIPGLSFFDRPDQQDLAKIHLPYIWRTEESANILFLPPINRPRTDGMFSISGMVECEWYSSAANLVMQLPSDPDDAVHVSAGDILAQAIVLPNGAHQPRLDFLQAHKRQASDTLQEFANWQDLHDKDRSAYKRLSKAQNNEPETGSG